MNLRHGRVAKWFPITLAVIGSFALLAGLFVASISVTASTQAQDSFNVPVHGAVYVGSNTCYTCHSEASRDWTLSLHPQTIVNTVVKPAIITNQNSTVEVRQIDAGSSTDAYTSNSNSQRYIVITEAGHTLLNGQPNTSDPASEMLNPDEQPVKCSGCHTTSSVQGRFPLDENNFTIAVNAWQMPPDWSKRQRIELINRLNGRFKVANVIEDADTRKSWL